MGRAVLRAGLLGLGMMGRHHARVLRSLDGVQLVAAADAQGDKQGVLDGLPVVTTVEELVDLDLDLCVVAVPTEDHLSAGLHLAAAGVPALIEKPLAIDEPAARQLVEAYAAAGLVGCVGHVERFNPATQALRERLDQLGRIFQIATRRQGPFPERIRDVGVVKDLATHDLDLTMWVAGSGYELVSAQTTHQAGRPYEDLVAVLGRLTDGTITSHLVNWLSPVKERRIIATGELGCFEANTLTGDLVFFANASVATEWDAISSFRGVAEGDMTRYALRKREPLLVELEAFRDAVAGLPADIVTFSDGLAAVQAADAVLKAAVGDGAVRVAGA